MGMRIDQFVILFCAIVLVSELVSYNTMLAVIGISIAIYSIDILSRRWERR